MVVAAGPEERYAGPAGVFQALELPVDLAFAEPRGDAGRPGGAQFRRDVRKEVLEALHADGTEHPRDILGGVGEIGERVHGRCPFPGVESVAAIGACRAVRR